MLFKINSKTTFSVLIKYWFVNILNSKLYYEFWITQFKNFSIYIMNNIFLTIFINIFKNLNTLWDQ